MATNFFASALREGLNRHHFNQAQLSEFLGVDPAYVSRWLKGSSPRLDQLRNVLTKLGWDLHRAHPDYDPFQDAVKRLQSAFDSPSGVAEEGPTYGVTSKKEAREVRDLLQHLAKQQSQMERTPVCLEGHIRGAGAAFEPLAKGAEKETYELSPALFREYDFAGTQVSMARVEDDCLDPLYPAGTILFLRRVNNIGTVPNGFEVLMQGKKEDGPLQLRRLVRIEEPEANRVDRLIGAPVTPRQEYVFLRPREASVHSVVIGAMLSARA